MKTFILLLLLIPVFGLAQESDSAWILNNYLKKEQYIPMRDGTRLFTSIYLPKDKSEKHPILILRTPYSCSPYGESNYEDFWRSYKKAYLKENYIMVRQDVRGKYMSEGIYMDVRPFNPAKKTSSDIDEASDTYDTVDWLVKNLDGNNGKVGVFGISYPGFYATQAAVSNHPAVVAVSPQAPVTEWFLGDDWHHNGAFMLMDAFNFYVKSGFGTPRPAPTTDGRNIGYQPQTNDMYAFYLNTGSLPNFTKLTGDSIAFWKEVMQHPDYDAWWKKRNAREALYNVKPAMLVVGGLFDAEDCYGAWHVYKAIEKQSPSTNNKLVVGPWSHGQWSGSEATGLGNYKVGSNTAKWYATKMEIPFFNYYLKGKGNVDDIKNANIFFTGENNWKQFDVWPPAGTKNTPLYFQPGGNLSWKKATAVKSYTEYISDPAKPVPYNEGIHEGRTTEYMTDDQRFAARRPDVIVFQTDTLTEDITLAGPLTAKLDVSISSTDADFVVKLIDVFPDNFSYGTDDKYIMNGYQLLVRGEIFRGRYRNSFSKPEAFTPGKLSVVKYELPDIAHTFKKGHRIMVQVQSSWFPLVDRNPQNFIDIYHAKDDQFKKSVIKIYHDRDHASNIILPVIK
jgi:putative CocE/NonD family hydrolase